jgi:probable DNA repair protein
MAAVSSPLLAALAEGAVVVTPNRRLARFLHREVDVAQRAAGRTAWPTPVILPYPTWLETLWNEVVQADAVTGAALVLTPAQAAQLWRQVIAAEGMSLLDPHGAAVLAAEAWSLVHEWGAGGESWRAWRAGDEPDDPSVFARWAEAYLAELKRADAQDLAQVPKALAACSGVLAARRGVTILAGFAELTPQQERLRAALIAAGADLRQLDTLPVTEAKPSRTVGASPRDEVVAALDWARARALQRPEARIGIVVEDLARRRDAVVALAQEQLCPGAILPGAMPLPSPFEISLGVPLASMPLVVAALDLIALARSRLTAGAAAALLRSPYLPAAEQGWAIRAAVEKVWLDGGYREVALGDVIAALESRSPALALRLRAARDSLRWAARASPRDWVDAWRSWLLAVGWPGSRPLDSGEYQAREAWERMLGQFTSMGVVTPGLEPGRAIDALRALAGETIFQPEGSAAPIQILGVLEGTGLAFDALWVAGLAADRWPPAPAPNPLLPIAWQRERKLPRASAQRELAYAEMLTRRFARAAPEVVFSSPASADDHELSPSTLILAYPERAPCVAVPTWTQAIAHSATLEAIADDRAPPLADAGTAPGGSRIVATQSDCPFQAVARYRLGAEPWPSPRAGLSPQERGSLLHKALAVFWSAVENHAAFVALPAASLAAEIGAAVERSLAELSPARWRNVPPLIRAGERRRLCGLLDAWLALERARPPFAVRQLESVQTLQLGGLAFRLRPDRVDALAAGGVAILDYKSGRVERPAQWFDERPRASQLGLYTLAQRAAAPEIAVRAVVYAQLRPGEVVAAGLAADADAWPGLAAASAVGPRSDWPALESWWSRQLGALAAEIAHGHAAVTPRESPLPCPNCGLYAVCRIQSMRHVRDSDAGDE